MLETYEFLFRILWLIKSLKSIYLKYNFCNNICSNAWGQVFFKKLAFIQRSFATLIETVIVEIDIVRKYLYFESILSPPPQIKIINK